MKFNLRPAIWACALAIAVTAFGTAKFATAYQSQEGLEHGRGHDKGNWQNGQYGERDGRHGEFRNPASQFGFQDGLNDGRSYRQGRRSFDPHGTRNFKNVGRNYNSRYGDRQEYAREYRQAYGEGYTQGYGPR